MKRTTFQIAALLTLFFYAIPGYGQWQKIAVTESQNVSSKGEVAPFSFTLPVGMDYWVHTTKTVSVSNTGDKADGHFYIGGLTLPSGLAVPVGLKMRTSSTAENYLQLTSPQTFKTSNDYVDRVASTGVALSFRFFDRDEPGAGGTDYYADNNGNLNVEVSQFTPEMIVQLDTLDYGLVPLFNTKEMVDSIQGFGKEPLRVSNLEIIPIVGGDIYTINSERGYAFTLVETTNQFRIIARPTVPGLFLAHLRVVSPNAFGGSKIIVLMGRAPAPDVTVAVGDTINFGDVPVGGTSNRTKQFTNIGEVGTSINGVAISQPVFSATTPLALPINVPQDLQFAFNPAAPGNYSATADVQYEHGGSKRLYLIGRGVTADVTVAPGDTIDFGTIPVGGTSNRTKQFTNVSEVATSIVSVGISLPIFSAITPLDLPANSSQDLQFAFNPTAPGLFIATADVQYAHGGSKRLYLKGIAGAGTAKLSTLLIDFDYVLIGEDSVIGLELSNIGDMEYTLKSVSIDNTEFSFTGPNNATQVAPAGTIQYQVAFHPTFHVDPYHEGRMTFTFEGLPDQVVILRGRDQLPINSLLKIDTNYYYRPGEEFTIYQRLIGDLSITATPVTKFSEFIIFDKDILELISVKKSDLIASNAWSLATGQNGGAIDITITSGSERLTGPGKLLELRFKVRETVASGTVTDITQEDPDYYTTAAALAEISDGKVHILDRCDPIVNVGTEAASFVGQNRPNPFNPATEIPYHVGSADHVKLELFNSTGALVGLLIDGPVEQGFHVYRLDATSLASGVYTYVFTTNGKRTTKRMTLTK